MADINALALSAQRKLDNGDAIFEADAVRKAINGVGIFDEKDVFRLMKSVGTAFARNKHVAQRAIKRRAQ
ncbi:hypothetical protein A2853_02615 [Candidatus Kaiserbacteria bacterium RIFCSPHIGHO2_01_FULL_55_17]|uniref:ATP-cone domain-containing protein n=1 Tax=Candidatus Kaiserbacteria bacterium RIFCSPHIGHO2_01_FULL_55_17 TaxID=1798484 RepID=A0A1F6D7K3_9BACT|nr:MAG: hypothetical protein A2853_02615 [Candidatus Kaiserbacteria bacterium RIFCSPHIGHO2_01_FULL_55_17]